MLRSFAIRRCWQARRLAVRLGIGLEHIIGRGDLGITETYIEDEKKLRHATLYHDSGDPVCGVAYLMNGSNRNDSFCIG